MSSTSHAALIESLLFALGKPLSRVELGTRLHITAEDIEAALDALKMREGGLTIVDDGTTVELRTSAQTSAVIEELRREEYSRDIGKAGLETLAAVLYRGPLTRAEIDFIRGVNSTQTLRTLMMRGLLRRVPHPHDARSYLFEPTTELLSQLGIAHLSDLPEYGAMREKLQQLEDAYRAQESDTSHEV